MAQITHPDDLRVGQNYSFTVNAGDTTTKISGVYGAMYIKDGLFWIVIANRRRGEVHLMWKEIKSIKEVG